MTQLADVRDAEALREKNAGSDVVVLLAAEHRDDVSPVVALLRRERRGHEKTYSKPCSPRVCGASSSPPSVAVYGLNKENPDETHPADPFNHYGKSKWQAEEVLQQWHAEHPDFNIGILRPTVIFGERNRGNVFNLLRQISSGRFPHDRRRTQQKVDGLRRQHRVVHPLPDRREDRRVQRIQLRR